MMVADFLESLYADLGRLDVLLHREILRLRAAYQLSLDEFRGLYISDEQVDELIKQLVTPTPGSGEPGPTVEDLTQIAAELHRENVARLLPHFPWMRLLHMFELTPLEQDLLLFAAAPELDRKYETIYAYLNNDVTRKSPTVDLAARLFGAGHADIALVRAVLLPEGTLVRNGLLELGPGSADRPASLSASFGAAPAVVHFLLGLPPEDARLAGLAGFDAIAPEPAWPLLSSDLRERLERLPSLFQSGPGPLIILEGPPGVGQREAARALCSQISRPLLWLDLTVVTSANAGLEIAIRSAVLQARLSRAAIFLERGDMLVGPEPGSHAPQNWFQPFLSLEGPVFLALSPSTPWSLVLKSLRVVAFRFDEPAFADRQRLWAAAAKEARLGLSEAILAALADRFVLTPPQIRAALQTSIDLAALNGLPSAELAFETLLEGARLQSGGSLGRLAVQVNPVHTWADLVLPPVTLQRVREVADGVRNSHIVYYHWQFGQRFNEGRGLKVLFSGASGTGKTMTAGVIARDLGLDLYKVDLSGVVSKYIGETEKNLDRVFDAARTTNAILFFDEADALFGKRSEVKDAHDRYANIEIAYLLQKMESHEGAVILATNLSKNIDEAFNRRMHYVVEFPLPDETHRALLWRGMFPPAAPLGEDVDFLFLARQFIISGGDIRNAALEAAFLAARDGKVIRMDHLVHAMARLVYKQGRLPSPIDFGKYYDCLQQA